MHPREKVRNIKTEILKIIHMLEEIFALDSCMAASKIIKAKIKRQKEQICNITWTIAIFLLAIF